MTVVMPEPPQDNSGAFAYLYYIASLQVADLLFGITVAVLVAVGFKYPWAWGFAMLLLVGGGLHISKRRKTADRRFHCSDCGIDYPNDMVQRT